MRKLRAFGCAPCAYYSNLRNAASPTKKKKLSTSSCDLAEGQPPLPMVLMFLPLVLGGWRVVGGGPGPTQRRDRDRDRNRGWSDATETERHLLLISMGKFPRSWRLAWSPPISPAPHPSTLQPTPDRQSPPAPPPLTSRERPSLKAPLALIQGHPWDRAECRSRHALTRPDQANSNIKKRAISETNFTPSHEIMLRRDPPSPHPTGGCHTCLFSRN